MFKKIKKYLKRLNNSNERGSVLSIALIVIAILTFSITTITQVTVNLAGATTLEMQQVSTENNAKGLINIAISEFQYFIEDPDELGTEGDYTTFINVHIPRIYNDYDVTVSEESNIVDGEVQSATYKFTYSLPNGAILTKYAYVSNRGSELLNFEPFDYSLGTNGILILNGGRYDDMMIHGDEILIAGVAPFILDGTTTQDVTPLSSREMPVFTVNSIMSEIWATSGYKYCEDFCYDTNALSQPFEINNETNFIDVVEGNPEPTDKGDIKFDKITDFFGDFDYDDYLVDFLKIEAPERDQEMREKN